MLPQTYIAANTPMGATLTGDGATFRCWAPRATSVYLTGTFSGVVVDGQMPAHALVSNGQGYWTGFWAGAKEGDLYRLLVIGAAGAQYKRDPYAREMATDNAFPNCSCVIRPDSAYPWHDNQFVTPDFSNMIVYQLHVGTYAPPAAGAASTFLDVVGRIRYMAQLGINVLQLLPIDEFETDPSLGYDGADYFSPDLRYVVQDSAALVVYLNTINGLLAAKGFTALSLQDITPAPAQMKVLVDLCHLNGIAVVFDEVYNHAGGFGNDTHCLYFWDQAVNNGDNNQSLYFTDQDRGTGGLSFALWNNDVRQFIINSAQYYLQEFHVDGFRYDEISALLSMNKDTGWSFCTELTDTLRFVKPRLLQNAEYWPFEFGDYPRTTMSIVTPTSFGGAGFDVVQHDALRGAVRDAIGAASAGRSASIDFDAIAASLYPPGLAHGWQAVTCIENHDIVQIGRQPRIPTLADGSNQNSWYACSRTRVATCLLLSAPGIPQLFMGQEILESRQWHWDPSDASHLIEWSLLTPGSDQSDFLRFMRDLIQLRWDQPALRSDNINVFHVHNQNRVIAFHRWLENIGSDVIVVATLAEESWYSYSIGFPFPGVWTEIFNSDVYQNFSNPNVAGNGGGIVAFGPAMHGFGASANIVIPANGVAVFCRSPLK